MRTQLANGVMVAIAIAAPLLPLPVKAQYSVQWQAVLGGTNYEECTLLQLTGDGGCVVGGGSLSPASGNKSATNYIQADYWLVKLDSNGIKQWDQAYGGSDIEYPNGLQLAPDGGFVLGGHSRSGVSGNKTNANFGGRDYWLVKTDASGNKQWDQEFGGTANETAWSLASVTNGYLLVGASFSGISGNKTSAPLGQDDWWVVKVDTNGIKQWEMAYGGTNNEYLYDAQTLADGGIVLVGESDSGASGNKSGTNYGSSDGWVIKIDGNGNKLWEQVFGGNGYDYLSFATPTSDGGCLVGGASWSGATGNKTNANLGGADWWLLKLDAGGSKQWEKVYGGNSDDYLKGAQLCDGGYLLFGTSWSGATGNKTNANFGESDYWMVKVDAAGNKQWELALGGVNEDYAVEAFQATADGGYLLGGYSESGATGNKTVAGFGNFDYWVIKLAPTPPKLTIVPAGPGQATISWTPTTGTNWVLQENINLATTNWATSPSGWTNPIVVPATLPTKFHRLHRP